LISWIVASHNPAILEQNLLSTLDLHDDDEIRIVWNATSIAAAYNEGQAGATRPVRCYVHHDVKILDYPRLRNGLLTWVQPWSGLVGVTGSWCRAVPWWYGSHCGSVLDGRGGRLGTGKGGQCAYLDGLLLATMQTVTWDESYPGWHGYDHDMCEQMLAKGLMNWCLDNGHELVSHETAGSWDTGEIPGFDGAMARFREKWGA